MYLGGHVHCGGDAFDDSNGIYHLTMPSTLNCDMAKITENYAVFHVYNDKIIIQGFGEVKS